MPFKIDRNKNQNRSIHKVQNLRKLKEGKYAKPLVKIQVTAIFLKQDMRRNVLFRCIARFVWRRHVGAHPDGLQHGGRKPTETSVTVFATKT